MSGIGFILFTMFWTALTFLLAGPPFNYPVTIIGLFGLAGLIGAIAAQQAGRLHDRGWTLPALGIGWILAVLAFIIALAGCTSIGVLIIAIIAVSIAIQGIGVLYQTSLFALTSGARSRLNTALVTNNFIGGAVGSAATTVFWSWGGWTAICIAGIALSATALFIWAVARQGPMKSAAKSN
jgi:hypothetical protein